MQLRCSSLLILPTALLQHSYTYSNFSPCSAVHEQANACLKAAAASAAAAACAGLCAWVAVKRPCRIGAQHRKGSMTLQTDRLHPTALIVPLYIRAAPAGLCLEGRTYFKNREGRKFLKRGNERTDSEWPLVAASAVESFAQGCVPLLGAATSRLSAPQRPRAAGAGLSSGDSLRMMAKGHLHTKVVRVITCISWPGVFKLLKLAGIGGRPASWPQDGQSASLRCEQCEQPL